MDVAFKTAVDIREAVVAGKVSATDVVVSAIADIKKRDVEIGAFLEVFEEHALARAKQIDAIKEKSSLALAGVPIAIKDNMLLVGESASAGSKMLEEYRASYTCTVVERLEAAGAIVIGRANCDEFAMGSSGENSAFHATKNPWNTKKVSGGSSAGSAAAVAAGMVPLALGSDTGGSIRLPAAFTGIVGLKPSYGRVSRYGIIALASSLDQVGPFARTTEDAALCLAVMEGRDEKDSTSVALEAATQPHDLADASFNGLRIGVAKEFFADGMDSEIADQVRAAVEKMKEQGAEIVELSLPKSPYALAAYYLVNPAEASSNLARFDGMRYGRRGNGNLEEAYLSARGAGFGLEPKRRIMLGSFVLSAGYYDAFYKKALAVRGAIRKEFDEAFKKVDVIVGPTSPAVAWNIGEKFNDPIANYLMDIFTVPLNLAGLPGISIPVGMAHDLPVGMQFIGKAFDDSTVLRAAAAFEKIAPWSDLRPKV